MASSVEMAVNTKEAEHQQGDEAKDAKVNVWDTESDISKNPKSISWYVIFASALANFSDGYQNNLSSNTNVIFKHTLGNTYTSAIQTRISNALLVGAVIGIVVLGYTCDIWSRRGGLWVTSSLVVVGSLLATLVFQVEGQGVEGMMWYMTIARGITGVGVGGEYPPSAAAALEGSNEHYDHIRGPIQVLTSTLMATSAAPICTAIYLLTLIATHNNLITAFHAIYSISIFLPLFVAFLRFRMRDGLLFRRNKIENISPPYLLVLKRYGWRLLGTSSAFFLYDFINFPNSIMSAAIINNVVPGKNIRQTAIWQFILALLAVPGPIVGSYLTNRIGRRWTGIAGWIGYIILGFIIGDCYSSLTSSANIAAFVVLYGLMQSFGHMGPGATIGLMSVELFPTAVRGVSYGVSAAFGKAGAAVGTQVFTPIRDAAGPASTFYLLGGLSILGAGIYWILPEGRDIDLAAEDESFNEYLRRVGWGVDKLST
ncbi:MFS general substrate transporter [Aureobasidium sp. EXF-3400]|nr:MFS general substrate transporter [Aureobasidium sp. EXF-12344]KAI4778109.1 MFS general substrate transporter [Aureobasidium sp. EXF-3400]